MFRGLPTASLALTQLFASPYLFTVPAYQRPYSWKAKEVTQLLEDVTSAAGLDAAEPATPDYFLGTILLLDPEAEGAAPPSPFGGPRVFEVVDGQQRLVTVAMLAAVLRDFEDRDGPLDAEAQSLSDRLDAMVRAEPNDRDLTTRTTRIRLSDLEKDDFEPRIVVRPAQRRIGTAVPNDLASAHDFIAQEVENLTRPERRKLARYLMDYCHVVIIVTRDIDRAHNLFTVLNERGRPLERKDILKAGVLRSLPSADLPQGLALWQSAQAKLGDEFENLFSQLRHTHATSRAPIIAGMRSLVGEMGSIAFLETIVTPMADALHRLRTYAQDQHLRRKAHLFGTLNSLARLGKGDWLPAAMLAMALLDTSPETAGTLLIEIERLTVLLRLRGMSSDKRLRRFAPAIAAMKSNPDTASGSSAFEMPRDEQRLIAHHLKDLYRRSPALTKLLLMRVEDEVAGEPLTIDPQLLTVEHVLPLRPAQTSAWRKLYPDSAEREICQTSLGNLTLVTQRQNDRAENKDFPEKLAIYREREHGFPAFVSNAEVLASSSWQPSDIRAREARLLTIIAKLYRLDLPFANGASKAAGLKAG